MITILEAIVQALKFIGVGTNDCSVSAHRDGKDPTQVTVRIKTPDQRKPRVVQVSDNLTRERSR